MCYVPKKRKSYRTKSFNCKLCDAPISTSQIENCYKVCQPCRLLKSDLTKDYGYTSEEADERLSYGQSIDGKTRYWGMVLNRKNKGKLDEK